MIMKNKNLIHTSSIQDDPQSIPLMIITEKHQCKDVNRNAIANRMRVLTRDRLVHLGIQKGHTATMGEHKARVATLLTGAVDVQAKRRCAACARWGLMMAVLVLYNKMNTAVVASIVPLLL
jgi:hypothetical protein